MSLEKKVLNKDAILEIMERSFAISYKLERFDVATRIRTKHPVEIILWEGEHVEDSRDRLSAFASVKFEDGWKVKYTDENWVFVSFGIKKIVDELAAISSIGMKYKAELRLEESVVISFGTFEYSNFIDYLLGLFDVFVNLETQFPKKDVPPVRAIYERQTCIFKDHESQKYHLGCKDRILIKDVLNSEVKYSFLSHKVKYLGLRKFKIKYGGDLAESLHFLDVLSYKQLMVKQMSTESISSEPNFADEEYRIDTLKTNSFLRISFQIPNEDDFNSFFVLVDFFQGQWRITATLDQYVALYWVLCKDLDTLDLFLRKSIIPNLFNNDCANLVFFSPEMSFFTYEFKSLDGLMCLFENIKSIETEESNSTLKKIYYNCHNGYCAYEKCKYGLYLLKQEDQIHLGFKNLLIIQNVRDNPFSKHLSEYFFLKRHLDEKIPLNFNEAIRYLLNLS
eukprot:NODE_40_length_35084_cov_0.543519.p7 type:complete len:451 gc:universal NODE_40_length_35084_cov_0.543519:1543-191(-)